MLYISLLLNITCLALLALFWNKETEIMNEMHSVTFLSCVIVLTQVLATM